MQINDSTSLVSAEKRQLELFKDRFKKVSNPVQITTDNFEENLVFKPVVALTGGKINNFHGFNTSCIQVDCLSPIPGLTTDRKQTSFQFSLDDQKEFIQNISMSKEKIPKLQAHVFEHKYLLLALYLFQTNKIIKSTLEKYYTIASNKSSDNSIFIDDLKKAAYCDFEDFLINKAIDIPIDIKHQCTFNEYENFRNNLQRVRESFVHKSREERKKYYYYALLLFKEGMIDRLRMASIVAKLIDLDSLNLVNGVCSHTTYNIVDHGDFSGDFKANHLDAIREYIRSMPDIQKIKIVSSIEQNQKIDLILNKFKNLVIASESPIANEFHVIKQPSRDIDPLAERVSHIEPGTMSLKSSLLDGDSDVSTMLSIEARAILSIAINSANSFTVLPIPHEVSAQFVIAKSRDGMRPLMIAFPADRKDTNLIIHGFINVGRRATMIHDLLHLLQHDRYQGGRWLLFHFISDFIGRCTGFALSKNQWEIIDAENIEGKVRLVDMGYIETIMLAFFVFNHQSPFNSQTLFPVEFKNTVLEFLEENNKIWNKPCFHQLKQCHIISRKSDILKISSSEKMLGLIDLAAEIERHVKQDWLKYGKYGKIAGDKRNTIYLDGIDNDQFAFQGSPEKQREQYNLVAQRYYDKSLESLVKLDIAKLKKLIVTLTLDGLNALASCGKLNEMSLDALNALALCGKLNEMSLDALNALASCGKLNEMSLDALNALALCGKLNEMSPDALNALASCGKLNEMSLSSLNSLTASYKNKGGGICDTLFLGIRNKVCDFYSKKKQAQITGVALAFRYKGKLCEMKKAANLAELRQSLMKKFSVAPTGNATRETLKAFPILIEEQGVSGSELPKTPLAYCASNNP